MFCCLADNYEFIISYVSLIRSKAVFFLINNETIEKKFLRLINIYKPEFIISPIDKAINNQGFKKIYQIKKKYNLFKLTIKKKNKTHKDLALLLSTSGSTGTSKFVKLSYLNLHDNPDIDFNSIVVDAACSGNPGIVEYRGISLESYEELFRKKPIKLGTNNMGEFLAIVHALCYTKEQGKNTTIYSDSAVAIGWVKKKAIKSTLAKTKESVEIWDLVNRALTWLDKNTYSNEIIKWDTKNWGEIPADYGRK